MAETKEVVMKNGNFIQRIIYETIIGEQESILSRVVEPGNVTIHNVFSVGQNAVHMINKQGNIVLTTKMDYLSFEARMELSPDGKQLHVPTAHHFSNNENVGSTYVTIKDKFNAPKGAFFSFNLKLAEQPSYNLPNKKAYSQETYLLLHYGGNILAPYYPNIYDNGRICMGEEWGVTSAVQSTRGNSIARLFSDTFTSFLNSAPSSHLILKEKLGLFSRTVDPASGKSKFMHEDNPSNFSYGDIVGTTFTKHVDELHRI